MTDEEKTKEQLIEELTFMRKRIAELEATESKRKLAEDALRESEESFRQLAENTKKVFWIADRDITETLYVSPAYEEIWGRTCASLSANPRSWLESVHPEDLDLATKSLAERGSDGHSMKYRIVRPDGSIRWILDRGFPVRDETGEIYRFAGIAEDITERVQQEREIQLLNRLYGVLSRVSQAVVRATSIEPFLEEACRVIVEEGGFLLSWIGYVEVATKRVVPTAIWGEAGDYVRGISVYVDDRLESRGPTGTCIREERPSVHNDFLNSSLTLPWRNRAAPFGIRASAAFPIRSAARVCGALTIYSDEVDFFGVEDVKLLEKVADDIGFALDNLERERQRQEAEAALRESEDRYRAFGDASSDMVYVKDDQLRHVIANNTLVNFFGRVEADVIGKTDFELMPELAARNCRSSDLEAIRAKSLVVTEERVGDRIYETTKFPVVLKGNKIGVGGIIRDITERKQAEDALRDSEEQFKAMFEMASIGMAQADPKTGQWLRVNQKMCEITGYSYGEILSMRFPEITHPDDRERDWKAFQDVINDRLKSYRLEKRYIRKDGIVVWASVNMTVIRDSAGQPMRTMATIEDITERKRAEEALKASERLHRSVIENIHDTFYRADIDGNLLMLSPSGATMFGYDSVDEMIGLNIADSFYVNPEDREHTLTRIKEQGYVKDYEVYLKRRDGTPVHISTSSHQYFDEKGVLLGIEGVLRDITDRRRVEEALRTSEERFSKAFHISPAPTIISTLDDGRYLDVNDSFLLMLGYSREEMIGHTASELNVWATYDDRKKVVQKMREQGSLRGELLHLQTKSGDIRYVLVSAEIITLNEKQFILSIFYDITDQRRLETQLHQTQKMEAIGTLAGGIAHDFNNILAAIIGYTEIARGKLQQKELCHYLDQVLRASDRAKNLVTQILAFSRKVDKEVKAVDIYLLITETLKLLRATIPSTIEIRSDIDSQVGEILADPTQLHQVMMNLCTNAAYAMREKGGILEVGLSNTEITPEMLPLYPDLQPGPYVKLEVNDTGTGIAPDIMSKIFDPFFTTKKGGEGTGLGLSVVYGIVKECGGMIAVQSEPDRGSTFSIYLPVIEHGEKVAEEPPRTIPRGKERILFIDDEQILVEMSREMLKELGYEVTAATSSTRGLEIFRAHPDRFDLVVTDMTMPGMTGKELATELLEIRPDIPIILCTGFSELITKEEAKLMGIREFAIKPLNLRSIAELIRKALDRKES